ncbi:MAG: NAD(P)/FAD-dependent oxidoreductase [Candidatus Nanopelagicales bacterium]|nr:NAD(P)/FAD-dependent oxidoreductase [Candidatus Nanopelagicales bacterium]
MSEHAYFDDIVIGAGHNGLVAAAYLARAGRSVLVLESADHVGGAAISTEVFPGVGARMSKYAYLVSLLPEKIRADLGMTLTTVKRAVSSFTPNPANPDQSLAIPQDNPSELHKRIVAFTGSEADAQAWVDFYQRTERVARIVFPTLTQPLMSREQMRELIANEDDWQDFFVRPLGEVIEKSLSNDTLRGIILTDALIGTFADAHDPSLRQNICFLYHVIGNGVGTWDVPVGGMGQVTEQLADIARTAGAVIRTGVTVTQLDSSDAGVRVHAGGQSWAAQHALVNATPSVLAELTGAPAPVIDVPSGGAQIKVNMLLTRLPQLRSGIASEAFNGTFHINEGYEQLATAVRAAQSGDLPDPLPAEIYCHSLTDPSILSPELHQAGVQTLTLFALHTPHDLFARAVNPVTAETARAAVLASLNSVLAEPIEECLYRGPDGQPCIEVNTTVDIENNLRIATGNIFHTPLEWPWARTEQEVGAWGVETEHPNVYLCGSGASRGGGVSGIPGHNAAQLILNL